MKKNHLVSTLAALGCLPAAHAAVLTLSTTSGTGADAGIRNDGGGPANNFGGSPQMILGSNSGAVSGLVRFDLSSLVAAAGGNPIVINSVTLTLHTSATQAGAGSNFTLGLNDYAYTFVEGTGTGTVVSGTATWNNPTGTGADATAGGTPGLLLQSLTIGSTAINQTYLFASSPGLVSDVQGAFGGANTVSYLIRETTVVTDQTFARFDTKETSGGTAPFLTIDYTIVPEPSSALLGCLGLLGLLRRRR